MEEERVPSTNELAKLYAINPATAAKGVNILVDEGSCIRSGALECLYQQEQRNRSWRNEKRIFTTTM